MRFRYVTAAILLLGALSVTGAQAKLPSLKSTRYVTPFSVDFAVAGLDTVTWAADSPTLTQLGLDISGALELATPISVPIRLEVGYIGVASSSIASTGESYRAWDGARIALLSGYSFAPIGIKDAGKLKLSALVGGAITAAEYSGTPLGYAYPSLILEPRALLALSGIFGGDSGPFIAIPVELMFRAGNHTLAPGIALGFRWRIIGEM